MMRRENERVTIDLTPDQFESLILILGYAAGAALSRGNRNFAVSVFRLVNAVNEGNPNFQPYDVPSPEVTQ